MVPLSDHRRGLSRGAWRVARARGCDRFSRFAGGRLKRPGIGAARTIGQLADARDLSSVIAEALAANPVDEGALRRGVWTFVGAERGAGAAPGQIINSLTALVADIKGVPLSAQRALLTRVTLWCVEAYFGRLGGESVGARAADRLDEAVIVRAQ